MTVQFKIDWDTAHLSGATYTLVTPEVPNGYALEFINSAAIDTAAWGGSRTIATIPNWNSNVRDTTWDGTIPTTPSQFRFLVEAEFTGTERDQYIRFLYAANDYARVLTSGVNPRIYVRWNAAASDADAIDTGYTIADDTPFVVECIVDTNNATAAQRVKIRAWAVGGSPGSFVNASSTSGAAGTFGGDFTEFKLGANDNTTQNLRVGRVLISDDITEDLSALLSSAAPKRMMTMGVGD